MGKEYRISKEHLEEYLRQGMSARKIGSITGIKPANILYYIKMYGIKNLNRYCKFSYKDEDFFKKIDTKEKAYALGFLIGDSTIEKNRNGMSVSISLQDKEILYRISDWTGCRVLERNITKREKKIFPSANIHIVNNSLIKDLKMLFGGRLKEERRLPIIKKELECFLIQGFFDAEGCITWGKRKDRDRYWQKISFTSQLKMLIGVQNILLKNNIATRIYPKKNENCYVLEITNKDRVIKTLDFIYSDKNFVILRRKFDKANALRRELGENGEGANDSNNTVPSLPSRKV